MAEERRKDHTCLQEGDIAVLNDFKERTEKYVNSIAIWFITNMIGMILTIAGVVYIIVKIGGK